MLSVKCLLTDRSANSSVNQRILHVDILTKDDSYRKSMMQGDGSGERGEDARAEIQLRQVKNDCC